LKKAATSFNKLKEAQKDSVLLALGQTAGKNGVERKKLFQRMLLTRNHSYDTIRTTINNAKE
jgi:signal recognition particle GTPase